MPNGSEGGIIGTLLGPAAPGSAFSGFCPSIVKLTDIWLFLRKLSTTDKAFWRSVVCSIEVDILSLMESVPPGRKACAAAEDAILNGIQRMLDGCTGSACPGEQGKARIMRAAEAALHSQCFTQFCSDVWDGLFTWLKRWVPKECPQMAGQCKVSHTARVAGAGLCCKHVGTDLKKPGDHVSVTDSIGQCGTCWLMPAGERVGKGGVPVADARFKNIHLQFTRGLGSCAAHKTGCCALAAMQSAQHAGLML